jgi:hypothetical protein
METLLFGTNDGGRHFLLYSGKQRLSATSSGAVQVMTTASLAPGGSAFSCVRHRFWIVSVCPFLS